jgi:rSAM/selenodomain-associated transferase 1
MRQASSPALVVFARVPVAGSVKTRLTPPLTPAEAADLYGAFLADALEAWAGGAAFEMPTPPAVRLYLASEGGAPLGNLAPAGVSTHEQRGETLGGRMLRATVETFAAGHDAVVLIGSDHPTLPQAFIRKAFLELGEPLTVVLGPSDDGGYYLIGTNEVIPSLFEGLSYSHAEVLAEALTRVTEAGARPVLLPPWYDVDTPEDLDRLKRERLAGARVGPRTAAVLDALQSA